MNMSNLIKTNPASSSRNLVQSMRRSMPGFFSDIFDDFPLTRFYSPSVFNEPLEHQIRINVSERPNEYFIRADIPGAKKENIHVSVEGSYVTIKAEQSSQSEQQSENEQLIRWECSSGSALRSFQLPGDINRDKAKAIYENGVLSLTLPKVNGGTIAEIAIQ
jgi:HSP20 family protein